MGTCWDIAVADAFFATLKADLAAEVKTLLTRGAATAWVATHIEGWDNLRRSRTITAGTPPMLELQHTWGSASTPVQPS